jgi:hypothetical protein
VLAPSEEYDQTTLVGATGWMLNPHYSGKDFPFTHPFLDSSAPRPSNLPPIFDWEFRLALDREPNNPRMDYQFLLAQGNRTAALPGGRDRPLVDEAINSLKLDVPSGLLGVEMDGGLVPHGFKTGAKTGDRIAVFGRWIVDTGHQVPEPSGQFKSEIHPPLLMARASIEAIASGQPGTRVLFTSRPYLVGQRFAEKAEQIYKDAAGDDSPVSAHLAKEFGRAATLQSDRFQTHPASDRTCTIRCRRLTSMMRNTP